MKNINKYLVLIALALLVTPGCKKLTDVNDNPNNPLKVTPATQFLSSELIIGFGMGGDMSRFAGLFDQQVFGAGRQAQSYYSYVVGNADFDAPWGNMYQGMTNLSDMTNAAHKAGNFYYEGVGDILMAYALGMSCDVWSDLPFSQAFQGISNLQPGFDKGADIYTKVQSLLDQGITLLNGTVSGPLVPGNDDIIYGGTIPSWVALAHGLKARFYLHTGKVAPANLTLAMTEVGTAINSWGGDAYVHFYNSEVTAAPWYQFLESRPGDITFVASTISTMMTADNDPRYASFIDAGADQLGPFYGNIDAGVRVMSLSELYFIRAELELASNPANAANDLNTGAINSVSAITGSAPPSAWVTAFASETAGTVTLQKIITQKYYDLFTDPEAYSDWRRTGFPTLTPVPGNALGQIPRRYFYAETETERNKNCPRGLQLTDHVWWDI